MFNFIIPAAALLTLVSAAILIVNWRRLRRIPKHPRFFWGSLVLGVLFGAGSIFINWAYDTNTRILGFPFPASVWHRDSISSPWVDFIGPLTLPFAAGNFLFWLLLAQIPLFLWKARKRPGNDL